MALLTTFANAVGSIPLVQLDNNFANVNSNAEFAITSGTVTGNVQANITQLGNLVGLTVSGNTVSNVLISTLAIVNNAAVLGNLSAENTEVNETVTANNLVVLNSAAISGAVNANSISANALMINGSVSAGNVTANGVVFIDLNVSTNSSANATVTLSPIQSYNLIINNANSNIIISPPPIPADGQIVGFTIGGNSSTNLSAFSGTWLPPFSGPATPGDAYKYVNYGNTWYKLG